MKQAATETTFMEKIHSEKGWITVISLNQIISHPPKNKIIKTEDIKSILEYSPKKNAANKIPEYSILYPETNSASASTKSNGVLFVSAKIEMKKTAHKGNNGKQNQMSRCCIREICIKFSVPDIKMMGKIINAIDTS
jgi:hypothetical protein